MAIPVIMQLLTMVILMVVGILLHKKKFLSTPNAKGLSIVLTRVAVPCNMIVLMQREYSAEIFGGFLKTCGTTFLMCCLGALMFFAVGKIKKMSLQEVGLFSGGGVYSNVIFMGQPLIMAMYGAEGLIFCVAVMFTCNVFLFTVCSFLFNLGGENKKTFGKMMKDAFLNLICLAAVIGVLCFVFSIRLPAPIFDALQFSANTTVCLSMIYIGTLLAAADVRRIFKDKIVYIFSFLTLIIMPIITKLIAGVFLHGLALNVLVILMGTPAAAALPSFAELYGNDEKRASEYVFVSTILSVFTLPLVAQFLCRA
ncbi:membrane transport protein [Anaerotignum neopropionicum]|uniref:Membrane transport protein n=1 Tax=Anaerotignum neopropionicum TaxID=36847 RepID=A0A136WHK4_9FIRM|nr:AEC family transporter [Anaerotignum neopropionicum]KXL53923.1 membrane transport protein [Anaerotignum neopropionicum]